MKITRMGRAVMLLAGICCLQTLADADLYQQEPRGSGPKGRHSAPPTQSIDDVVSSIPVLGKLPRSFIIGDGFRFKLSGQELRIDHMGSNSKSAGSKRNCMIGFSYTTPVAFFGSRIDIPLFHAERFKLADWGMNTPGDYVVHLSKDAAVDYPILSLAISARF